MAMARLRAGCALSLEQASALDQLTALKKTLAERGETGQADPVLGRLIEEELQFTKADLAARKRTKPDLWAHASALHQSLSEQAFDLG